MNSRRQILLSHYARIARKAANWVGLVALLGTTFVAGPALALGNQMGARSVTPTTLKAAQTGVSYAVAFKPGTTGAVSSIKLEICDSPLESVACAASATAGTNSNGANVASSTFPSAGFSGAGCTSAGTWVTNGTQVAGTTGTFAKWKNTGTANSITAGTACTFTTGTITNPAGNNQKYYLRMTTYSDTNNAVEVDFGGFALQTAQDLTINASVQEQLAFCVGQTIVSTCSSVGSGTVSLGTGTGCPVLSTSNNCTGTSQMAASTNAATGYLITYNGTTFTGPSDTITAVGSTVASSTPASKQFGLAGTTASGGSGAFNTSGTSYDYATNGNKYAYVTGSPQNVAQATAATAETIFTVTYMANVDATTKPGQYVATINYVCTGLF